MSACLRCIVQVVVQSRDFRSLLSAPGRCKHRTSWEEFFHGVVLTVILSLILNYMTNLSNQNNNLSAVLAIFGCAFSSSSNL